jgi:hypothetical protein
MVAWCMVARSEIDEHGGQQTAAPVEIEGPLSSPQEAEGA